MSRDRYEDALLLSEGRYEAKERHRELPEVVPEVNHKSKLIRINERVVKRIHSDLKSNNIIKKEAA